ncbi:MAG: cyclic nucleotide-binding domain-containing protein [Pseudomonadota bacterium]
MESETQITVYLFFLANIIYCCAYVIREILWLRVLTVIGALCTFPYFIFQAEVLYSALLWQSAFAIINIFNIVYLVWDRKPVEMTAEQRRLHSLVFREFTSRNVVRLLDLADWHVGQPGDVLIEQGRKIDKLYLTFSGLLVVEVNGEFTRHIRDGEFVGELSYILKQKTSATVTVVHETHYLSWDRQVLEDFLDKHSGMRPAFKNLLNYDIAGKLAWPNRVTGDDQNAAQSEVSGQEMPAPTTAQKT